MSWYAWQGQELVLDLRIQTRARKDELVGIHDGRLRVRITAPPVEGKANRHLISFLAQLFGVPQNRVEITHGAHGREKRVRIHAPKSLPELIQPA